MSGIENTPEKDLPQQSEEKNFVQEEATLDVTSEKNNFSDERKKEKKKREKYQFSLSKNKKTKNSTTLKKASSVSFLSQSKIFSWISHNLASGEIKFLEIIKEVLIKLRPQLEFAIANIGSLKIPWFKIISTMQKFAAKKLIDQQLSEFLQRPQNIESIIMECISKQEVNILQSIFKEYGNIGNSKANYKLNSVAQEYETIFIQGCQVALFWLALHELGYVSASKNDLWIALINKASQQLLKYCPAEDSQKYFSEDFYIEIKKDILKQTKELWDALIQGELQFLNLTNQILAPQHKVPESIRVNEKEVQSFITTMSWQWEDQWYKLLQEQNKKSWAESQQKWIQQITKIWDAFPYFDNPVLGLSYFLKHKIN